LNRHEVTRLTLIRHAETPWTLAERYQGNSNGLLTDRGVRQAHAIAKRMASQQIDVVYTSSLERARETSEIIAKVICKKPCVDTRLGEISFGLWEGKNAQELLKAKDPAFLKWCKGIYATPPCGESNLSLRKRVLEFLREKLKSHKGKHIAVISHQGPIRTMVFRAFKTFRSFWTFQISPASISVLNFFPNFVQLVSLNETGHLDDEIPPQICEYSEINCEVKELQSTFEAKKGVIYERERAIPQT